jgi:BRCA1/BRCA2-containing complex subunit 3
MYKYCNLIRITVDAYSSCLNHVLLTDAEEVMGLLLGLVENVDDKQIIYILSTICLNRKCKEKDRVEFDEMQIAKASEIAEGFQIEHGLGIHVVGWYHSHPKITVPPSNVDLNTQFSQQYQGPFVGLIISCFNTDSNNKNTMKMIAFQTVLENNGLNSPLYIDIEFINESQLLKSNISNSAKTFASILKNLIEEEENEYKKEINHIDKADVMNKLLLFSHRQSLLTKIIQNVSIQYNLSLESEYSNIKNYLNYVKNLNSELRNSIKNFEDISKFREDTEY